MSENVEQLITEGRRAISGEVNGIAPLSELLERMIAVLEQQRWIPVSEPPDDPLIDDYVVRTVEGVSEAPALYNGHWFFWDGKWEPYGDDIVTHWMPLPPTGDRDE